MPIHRHARMLTKHRNGEQENDPCEVRIDGNRIVVSYVDDEEAEPWVVYEGQEEAPGKFILAAPKVRGTATLIWVEVGRNLTGDWKEGRQRGIWTIELGDSELEVQDSPKEQSPRYKWWSGAELKILRSCKTMDEARKRLERSAGSIAAKAKDLEVDLARRPYGKWNAKRLAEIANAGTASEAGKKVGASKFSVRRARHRLRKKQAAATSNQKGAPPSKE